MMDALFSCTLFTAWCSGLLFLYWLPLLPMWAILLSIAGLAMISWCVLRVA